MQPEPAPLDGERELAARLLQEPRHLPRARLLGGDLSSGAGGYKDLGELDIIGISSLLLLNIFQLRKSNIQLLITEEKVKYEDKKR